jgi:hypothetical protein
VFATSNLYPGLNAHLNSYLQNEAGGWESFHAEHIIDIARLLDPALPAGYFVRPEKTLQIRETTDYAPRSFRTTPDVTIYGTELRPRTGTPVLDPLMKIIPLTATLGEEDLLTGLVIYQAGESSAGQPVTRIELLSPGNKPPGAHHEQYALKRRQTLQSGLRLVEIDYLHQSRPAVDGIPSYPDSDPEATPYVVIVSDPRPSLQEAVAGLYQIEVDQPLPHIVIPLSGTDTVRLDLQAAYHQTFNSNRFYGLTVNYAEPPLRFDTYAPADRTRIQRLMQQMSAS